MDNEYLGITEAAEYLRVSASTLRRWEKKGFLVPERTPTGIRRYTKQQLDDVIQSPDGFSQTHSPVEEQSHKLAPHEELQASIEKQLEEISDNSYPEATSDVHDDSLLSNSNIGEVGKDDQLSTASVVHDYPPYGMKPGVNHEYPVKASVLHEPEVVNIDESFQDQIEKDFYNMGSKQTTATEEEPLVETTNVKNSLNQERINLEPRVTAPKVEVFHSEYDGDVEPPEDLEEYDSDAASAIESNASNKKGRSIKLPKVPVWMMIAGAVLIVIVIVAIVLLTKNSASELISPLAE